MAVAALGAAVSLPQLGPRRAWILLGAAMAVSATWLLLAGRGLSFASDDLFYYAHYVVHGGSELRISHGLEYYLAPSNGHLQVLGKVIYDALFGLFGGNYAVFRVVNVAAVMLSVGLFFELARRRIGPAAALVPCLSLLFLGFAWEPLLWAFDMHTTLALAFGLAAFLALERGDRTGDVWACLLLVLSVSMIELGLAFVVGAGVAVALGGDRWRRVWVVAVPVVLYAAWWAWSRHYDQSDILLSNTRLIPKTISDALGAIGGSVFGFNPTGEGVFQPTTEVTAAGMVVAGIAVVALVWRLRRGAVPATLWSFLAVALAYWVLIALGGRGADSCRYILVGTVLVFLVASDALAGLRIPPPALLAALCVVALAIPPNVAKLNDGRAPQRNDGMVGRTEYGMLDLARGRVDPDYAPGRETPVVNVGGSTFTPLPAGDYLRAAREFGPLGYSPEEIEGLSPELRKIADATLAGAYRLRAVPTTPPLERSGCRLARPAAGAAGVAVPVPAGGLLLGAPGEATVSVGLVRFGDAGAASVPLVNLAQRGWVSLRVPRDAVGLPWKAFADGPIEVCG